MPALNASNRELRRGRVTASWSIAAMVAAGIEPEPDPFHTPLGLYGYLVNGWESPGSDASRAGVELEAGIARLVAAKYGWSLRANHRTRVHRSGRLAATPDYLILGERAYLECKYTASSWPLEEMRRSWYWQAVAQLACSPHIRRVEVVALSGAILTRWTVDRDRAATLQLLGAIDLFHERHVIPRIPPAPDLVRDPAELVLSIPELPAGTVTAAGELRRHGDRYRRLVGHRKAWETREGPVRAALVAAVAASAVEVVLGRDWRASVVVGRDGRRSLRFSVNGESPMR